MNEKYQCKECKTQSKKWFGRCFSCGAWDSFFLEGDTENNISISESECGHKVSTGIMEFDRLLDGGVVVGSVNLMAGGPGVGKSTLLLTVAHHFCQNGKKALYISGEESALQVNYRAKRLSLDLEKIKILFTKSIEDLFKAADENLPDLIIIDSIQSIGMDDDLFQGAKSINEIMNEIIYKFKRKNIIIFLVAQITKENLIAGPKGLEHLVDSVIRLETNNSRNRIIFLTKNRFGTTKNLEIFQLDEGIKFLGDEEFGGRAVARVGVANGAELIGNRIVRVEIQSLVNPSATTGRRISNGIESNRLQLLSIIVEKYIAPGLDRHEIFINVTNGIRLNGKESDLAIVFAIYSSLIKKRIKSKTIFLGEIDLTGMILPVLDVAQRMEYLLKSAQVVVVDMETKKRLFPDEVMIIGLDSLEEIVGNLGLFFVD